MDAIQEDRDGPSMDPWIHAMPWHLWNLWNLWWRNAQPNSISWLGMPEKDQELQCAGAVSICIHLFPSVSMML